MSWEENPPINRPCPCGAGHYAVIERSDDWNRFDERWEMHCPACKAEYGLYVHDYLRKGMATTYRGWASRSLLQELSVAKAKVEEAKKNLTADTNSLFGDFWNEHFAGKTKKAIWRELTEDGKHYPSLQTFYAHVRDASLDHVLKRYFEYRELPTVIRILGPAASELSARLEQVKRLEHELEELDTRTRKQAVN